MHRLYESSSISYTKPERQILFFLELGHGNTNFVLSPLSIHSVFTQVLIGAGGKTQAELARILGISRSRRLKDQYSQLSADMPALKTANILALNKGFTPAKSFVQYLKNGFGSEVREYDMKNDKIGTVEEVKMERYSIIEKLT